MSKAIRIIAGLGNPEEKYERTLHNAGFWFVDALARKHGGLFRYEKKFDADYCRINLHGEDFIYETDEQRMAVITEYLIFQLQLPVHVKYDSDL